MACAGPAVDPDLDLPATGDSGETDALAGGPPPGVNVSALGPPPFGLADVAVTPEGTVWVSWIAEDPNIPNGRDILVSRSTDGVTFEAPVVVDGDHEPTAIWPRLPRLSVAADGGILVAFSAARFGTEAIEVFRAAPGETTFELIFERVRTVSDDAVEFLLPVARSGPAGDTWVGWVAADGSAAGLLAAREGQGWSEQRVDSNDAEATCTCCPIDLAVSGERAAFVWRGGLRRELVVSEANGAGYDPPVEITSFGLVFLACPLDGPQLVGRDGLFEVLASDTAPATAAVWSVAEDAPGHWRDPVPVSGDAAIDARRPSVAVDGARSRMAYESADGPRLATLVEGAWGEGALWPGIGSTREPIRLAAGGGQTWAVRVGDDNAVWVARVAPGIAP